MQTRRKRILISSAFLFFFLFPTISLSKTPQNTNTPYLYKNKQDCLDKNIGPNGSPNDLIKLICDTANYPKTSKDIEENEKFIQCKLNGNCDSRGNQLFIVEKEGVGNTGKSGIETMLENANWEKFKRRNEYDSVRRGMEYIMRQKLKNPGYPNPLGEQLLKMSEGERQRYACNQLNGGMPGSIGCPY